MVVTHDVSISDKLVNKADSDPKQLSIVSIFCFLTVASNKGDSFC